MPKSSKDKVVAAAAKAAAKAANKSVKKKEKGEKKVKIKKEVKKEVDKEVARKTKDLRGPKPAYKVKVSATLGHISGNTEHGPELKMSTFLHPSLVKGPDDSTEFGPLQAAAAQYGLWRCSRANIVMTPLVGPSAVSGTVERLSVNLTQSPSSTNWGGLGARKHMDAQAGIRQSMRLTRRDLNGPRDGGWWLTDTNAEGAQSAGPLIEIHGLGQTMSTYKNEAWQAELYIVELTGEWEFANYSSNPSLGQLDRVEEKATATLSTTTTGEVQLQLSDAPALLRLLDDPTAERATPGNPPKPGEVIYQIVDTAASFASQVAPPPFGWLIKGGWWFIKKIIGAGNAPATFLVYPSLADAQNNRPCISTQHLFNTTNPVTGPFQVTQLNAPNMGGPTAGTQVTSHNPLPLPPSFPPIAGEQNDVMFLQRVFKVQNSSGGNMYSYPPALVDHNWKKRANQTFYRAAHFRATQVVSFTQTEDHHLTSWGYPTLGPRSTWQLPQHIVVSSGNVDIYEISQASGKVGDTTDQWVHVLLWDVKGEDRKLPWSVQSTNDWQGTFLQSVRDSDATWRVKPFNTTIKIQNNLGQLNKLENGPWLTVWFTNGRDGQDLDWANVNWNPNQYVSAIMGIMFQGGNSTPFTARMGMFKPTVKQTKLEKLAVAMGLNPEDFQSDTDASTDAETASEGESSDEEGDDDNSEASFDVIPPQNHADGYIRLREQGLDHEQALEVLRINNPAV
nr:capsid protein precursor [Bat astrovirus]